MSADRTAQLDFVIDLRDVMHEGRDLAVIEPFDRELEFFRPTGSGRGSDRIAALGAVTVGRGQPQQDVLARREPNWLRKTEEEAFHARRERLDARDDGALPVHRRQSPV